MGWDPTFTGMEQFVDTKGLQIEDVFAALYNAGVPFGLGAGNCHQPVITAEEAAALLCSPEGGFGFIDWIAGKRMHIDFSTVSSALNCCQYEFYYGQDTAKRAIEILRETGDLCHSDIVALQQIAATTVATRTTRRIPAGTETETSLFEALELSKPIETGDYYRDAAEKSRADDLKATPCLDIHL